MTKGKKNNSQKPGRRKVRRCKKCSGTGTITVGGILMRKHTLNCGICDGRGTL